MMVIAELSQNSQALTLRSGKKLNISFEAA